MNLFDRYARRLDEKITAAFEAGDFAHAQHLTAVKTRLEALAAEHLAKTRKPKSAFAQLRIAYPN